MDVRSEHRTATLAEEEKPMMNAQPQKQHEWLQRLVGDWTFEHETPAEPGKPAQKCTGTETVRSLGGLWIVCEGRGQMPGGGAATTIMTLGYDPAKKRFVGTFIGSMMFNLWLYEGELDEAANKLTLDTEGPSFAAEGKLAKYKDAIELRTPDHRVLTSHVLGDDGKWQSFMTAHYRRTKQH
jgi:hypothetical protein